MNYLCGGCGFECGGSCDYARECAPYLAAVGVSAGVGVAGGDYPCFDPEAVRCAIGADLVVQLTGEGCPVDPAPGCPDVFLLAVAAAQALVFAGVSARHCAPLRTTSGAPLFPPAEPPVIPPAYLDPTALACGSPAWVAAQVMFDFTVLATRYILMGRTNKIIDDDPPLFVERFNNMVNGWKTLTLPGVQLCGVDVPGSKFAIGVSRRFRRDVAGEGCYVPDSACRVGSICF